MRAGYTNGALTVGLEVADTDGSGAGKAVNTISLGYTMGALTVSYDADDKATVANDNRGGSTMTPRLPTQWAALCCQLVLMKLNHITRVLQLQLVV